MLTLSALSELVASVLSGKAGSGRELVGSEHEMPAWRGEVRETLSATPEAVSGME